MNSWYAYVLVIAVPAVGIVLWNRWQTRKIFDSIERMIEMAMADSFTEDSFDESRLSALETKFAHYISASAVSARNVKKEKDKIKSLISDISHQTKTPIANLLLYCELLQEEELSETARGYTDSLHGQAKKLRFLIDALVKLSRLENGILVLHPKEEELQPMLQEVCAEYSVRAEGKGLKLVLAKSEGRASFDPKWTAEAIGNLIDNAIKYTAQGGVIVSVNSYEMFVRIDVADTGVGIPEEEQAKIFSRFYRSGTSGAQEGVGIGLYLSREIVAAEGGYIKVSSQIGKGSVFSVFLPKQPHRLQILQN